MIVLHTLGDALIEVGDRKVRPSSPLVFASLLYLATERGRRVPRAALQEMFFPKSDERSGSHSVRQLLYKLRRLGVPLNADSTAVLLPVPQVRDDTTVNGDSVLGAVDYLPDYAPDISERFSQWLDNRRHELAGLIRRRLVASIETNRERLDWPAVERDASLLQRIDPYNEIAIFASAEATALTGGKAAALAILNEYQRATGRTDLRLPASLLRQRILASVPDSVPTLSALPFLGRDSEVIELRHHIARALAGFPGMFVIAGDPGIGKSRLLSEVTGVAALEGVAVFTIRCQAHYATRPLSVFIELVPLLRSAPGALGISPNSFTSLNALTSHADADVQRSPDSRDDVSRSEILLAAIRDLIGAVAHEQPLLIAVEDAHWADYHSLLALSALTHSAPSPALMVICTTRTPETLPQMPVHGHMKVRRLRPLPIDATADLALQLLRHYGASPNDALIDWSIRTSGGNPLLLQIVCSHYKATGQTYTVPPAVLDAVTARVQALAETNRRLLVFVALLGRHTSVDLLRAVTGWTDMILLDAVQYLEEHGYLHCGQRVVGAQRHSRCPAAPR